MCASFLFGFEGGGMWNLVALIPDHCLSVYPLKLLILYLYMLVPVEIICQNFSFG